MFKKILFLGLIFLMVTGLVFAGGGRDKNESREAEDPTNFTDTFDLSDRKVGKWNFYIEAQDRAGNVTLAGPANIFHDPETDLPTVSIVNPMQNMRVQGNLNIVGIANDDDAVQSVDVVVTRGGDGKGEELVRVKANGTDYWSYMLNTTDPEIWKDGTYTVTSWATDIRGLSGDLSNASEFNYSFKPKQSKVHQIYWQLDRKKPDIQVTSHEIGELVKGKIRLGGTVYDGNMMASFMYSLDGGERYLPAKISYDKNKGLYNWNIDINTTIFDDGPAVIWFKGLDTLGSEGTQAHLLFVNNTGPKVEIVYPGKDAVLNGVFAIAGYASHPIGVKSLSWKAGRFGGDIEILPGNHWWSAEIDLRGSKESGIEVEIRAEDVSGNVTVRKQRVKLNPNSDLPIVNIDTVVLSELMENTLKVDRPERPAKQEAPAPAQELSFQSGVPASLQAVIDELPPIKIGRNELALNFSGSNYSAKFKGNDFSSGTVSHANTQDGSIIVLKQTHVYLRGNRITSPELTFTLEFTPPASLKVIPNIETASNTELGSKINASRVARPFKGTVQGEGNNIMVKGEADDDDGIAFIYYSLNNGEPVEIPAASGDFQFMIPEVAEGTHSLDVWAKDVNGVIGPKANVKNIQIGFGPPKPSISTINAGGNRPFYSGMTVRMDPKTRVSFEVNIRAQALTNCTVQIGDNPPATIRPSGSGGNLKATVQLPNTLDTGLTRIIIKATDRQNRETTYYDYIFIDSTGSYPARMFEWVRPKEVGGRILLESPDDSLIGISNEPIENPRLEGAGADALSIEADQYGRAVIRASREGTYGPLSLVSGTLRSRQFTITADFSTPIITVRDAPIGRFVQRSASARFTIQSSTAITRVESSIDMGESWQSIGAGNDVSRTFDLTSVPDGTVSILVRAVNSAGKSSMTSFTVLKDTTGPDVTLVMPIAEYRVNGTIRMGFDISEPGKLRSVTYVRDGASRVVYNEAQDQNDYSPSFIEVLMDSIQMPLARNMAFIFEDMAGNRTTINRWPFVLAPEDDIPVVEIVLPLDNEVITSDFVASGVCFDDDGIRSIRYRIDQGAWQTIEGDNGFSIPIALRSLTDNEHSISVIAEDIYGVSCPPVVRRFRVSLAEPVAAMTYPAYDTVVRNTVELRGTASDGNGIKEIHVSINNGATYVKATGTTSWSYSFDTNILKDGAHVIFIKAIDNYDIEATYAGMINVDNTDPDVTLDSPIDGFMAVNQISVLGRVIDPNLTSLSMEIRSLTGGAVRENLRSRRLEVREIVREVLDLSGQADGLYNVELTAVDKAGNRTRVSRNFQIARQIITNHVDILYPIENEILSGKFYLYGYAGGADEAEMVTLRVNGVDRATAEVDKTGYWRFPIDEEILTQENNQIVVHSNFGGYTQVRSRPHNLIYKQSGPYVAIDTFNFGQFAYRRPYLAGRTGYILSEEDQQKLADRNTPKEEKEFIKNKTPKKTEISFDNGRTYGPTKRGKGKNQDFRFRIESADIAEGMHYILVKTTMKNDEVAITSMIIQVDHTFPTIRLISPENGGRYNEQIAYSASAQDDVELVSTSYHLRVGDKAMYELPGFLQGLYFEFIIPPVVRIISNDVPTIFAGGATFMDFGLGLSFFDDNVKVQFNYGFQNEETWDMLGGDPKGIRYGGNVFGLKLLANIYHLEFRPYLGPDWEWLSLDVAIGANFSLFDLTQSGESTWLSALLMQLEFPKATIPDWKKFRKYSLFTEGQLWFVPTDVDAAANDIPVMMPKVIIGVRIYAF